MHGLAAVAGMTIQVVHNPDAPPLRARITRLGTTRSPTRSSLMAKRKTKAKTKRKTTKRRKRRG